MALVPATNIATKAFFIIFFGGMMLTMFGMLAPGLFAKVLPFAIGAYAVAAGLPTHVGVMLPVLGSPLITEVLTEKVKELTGGYFIVDLDPESSADKLLAAIDERRAGLGL
jgi:energy-converting hydrogenase Eha subunit B